MATWHQQLARAARAEAPCVLGIGNRLRGDDAIGPAVCERLRGRFAGVAIDGGVAPENHLERVVASGAALVVVVDAADFGGRPGQARVLSPDQLRGAGVSTHACSPQMLSEYLAARRDPAPTVRWLVIQPHTNDGPEMSPAVALGVERLAQGLCERWPAKTNP